MVRLDKIQIAKIESFDGTDAIHISADGNIGIGTNAPANNLHIKGGANGEGLTIQRTSTTSGAFADLMFSVSTADNATPNAKIRATRGSSYSDTDISIITNNIERMRIDSSGNVGIGTDTPIRDFHVHASTLTDIHITNNDTGVGSTDGATITMAALDLLINNRESGILKFSTAGTERMRIDSAGSTIITTNTGSQPFYITRSGGTDQSLKIYTSDSASVLETKQDETTGDYGSMRFVLDGGAPDPTYTFRKGSTELLRIEGGTGNVGIGTISPSSQLHLSSTSANSSALTIQDDARKLELGRDQIVCKDTSGSATMLYINPNANTAFATTTGNVGIGTISPTAKLHVVGDAKISGDVSMPSVTRYHSTSDYANGIKVSTSIPSDTYHGFSFIIEVVGKSYSPTKPPHRFIAQGYLYNGTIINSTAVDMTGSLAVGATIKIWDDNGTLAFWWARQGYWNSYQIRVYKAGSNSEGTNNLVTLTANSNEPATSVSKYVSIPFKRALVSATNNENYSLSFLQASNLTASDYISAGQTSRFTTGGSAKVSIKGLLSIGESNTDLSYIRRNATGKYQWQTYNDGNSGEIHLQPYGGNVGIGTTTPSTKFQVNGVITATSGNSTNWNTAYGWGDHSVAGYAGVDTIYTHPIHPGDDFSVDTGALSGATVVSDIDINVTTDGLGHVTDANGTVATRTLTLGDLGYTGATNANNYSLPLATSTVRGGIELFSNTDQSVAANAVSSTAGRTYGVQLNSANQAVVNVPWSDTNTDTNTQLSTEEVQDIVGAMFTGNTETRIAATYQDGDGTIDLSVTDMTANDNDDVSETNLKARLAGLDSTDTLYIGDSGDDTTVVIRGTLQVDGTTTTINSNTLSVGDNTIVLNSDVTGTPTQDAGIKIERGTPTDASLIWDESSDYWKAGLAGSEVQIALTNGTYSGLRAQGTTASDVGLGNVTNESKATMFSSPTFTGTTVIPDLRMTGDIRGNGQELILNAGEAANYATGQTGEYIYLNAEHGLQINSETGNWIGGWAARKTAYLRGDQLSLDGEALTKTNIQNFKTAYGWGDHSSQGYITSSSPAAPTNLVLSVVGQTVNVTFTASTTSGINNYLVFGSVSGGDYGLISVIPPADFGATMSIIDDSFDATGAQAYRVYAVKNGMYSSPLTGSQAYSVSSAEPTNLSVINLNSASYVQWDPPSSNARFVTAYNVYKHEHAAQGSLSRSSASLVYSGLNTSYMYQISGVNNTNYHQFWVETTIT